ncbi:MAG: RNA-binding protein [Saprospiraceae bacterium]|nr:RNA-binding protein [Saprospiraceae bacterium]
MDIFVGSIPFKFKDNDLYDLFEPFGKVSGVKIIISNITRQNKGFCFVTMADEAEATKAIAALNGTEIEGRKIIVSKADGNPDEMAKKAMRHGTSSKSGGTKNFSKGGSKVSGFRGFSGGPKGGSAIPKGGGNRGK